MGSFFLNGGLAWATLGLISIPIIIHLLNRRRFRRIDWAAMEFLLQALKKNRRRIRIEQLILLLLRVALMACLGLFLARPILSEKGLEWLASAFRSEDKIFILDDSFSTSEREADRTAFQRGIDALSGQVRRLAERSGGDRLTLVYGSRLEPPLLRAAFVDREKAAGLGQTLARLTPTDTRLPLAAAIESVLEAAARDAEGATRPRAITIITDLRAADWTNGQGGPNEEVARALRKTAEDTQAPTRVTILDVGPEAAQNVAIIGLSLEGSKPVAEIPVEIKVEVRNFGATAVRGLGLRLRQSPAGSAPDAAVAVIGPAIDEIPPRASMTYVIPCTFRTVGHHGVAVELTQNRDALPGDDAAYLAIEVVAGVDVLLVSGEPSSEPFEGETDFLEQALAPEGEVPSGIKPQVVLEDAIPRGEIGKYAAVFLANLHSVPQESLAALGQYVRAGGTLVVLPGDQTDPALWNRQLGSAQAGESGPEKGLLPARLGELKVEAEPLGLTPALDHGYFRLLRDAADLIGSIRFEKRYALEPVPGAQVVARFNDTGASIAMVEHAVEKGRVVLLASAADLEWNDWPKNPAYLMTFQEIVATAARSGKSGPGVPAGSPVEVPIDIATHASEVRWRGPAYPQQPEKTLVAESRGDGAEMVLVVRDTAQAGLCSLALRTKAGEEEWRQVAIVREAQESNPERVAAAKLKELYPGTELTVIKDATGLADVGRGHFEASDVLLWGFLLILFVEAVLARVFAHHTRTAAPAPGASA